MKKIISVITTMTILISSIMMSYASPIMSSITTNDNFFEAVPTVQELCDTYENAGFEVEVINESEKEMEYKITSSQDASFESYVDASVDIEGSQILDITEGGKHDELRFCTDGRMLLNGSPVSVTIHNNGGELVDERVIPFGGQRIYYQDSAPYGKNSEYTKFNGTVKKDLSVGNTIAACTQTALVLVVMTSFALSGPAGVVLDIGIAGVIAWHSRNDLKAKTWSVEEKTYVHNTKGFNVTSTMSTYKKNLTHYAFTNNTGEIGKSTFWQVFAY